MPGVRRVVGLEQHIQRRLPMGSRKSLPRTAGLLLGAAAVGSAVALAAVLYVSVDRLDVVDKKRTVAKTVVTVDRNAQLNVIAKEGRWYLVEVGGKKGYVAETVVADKPGAAKGKGVSLAAVK